MQYDRSDVQRGCAVTSHVLSQASMPVSEQAPASMKRRILKGAALIAPLAVPALLFALPTLSHVIRMGVEESPQSKRSESSPSRCFCSQASSSPF